jgi:hypothetical protein
MQIIAKRAVRVAAAYGACRCDDQLAKNLLMIESGTGGSRASSRNAENSFAQPRTPYAMEKTMKSKSILDPTFRYTSSANTDLRKTFARIRRELRAQAKAQQGTTGEPSKVAPIFGRERRVAS